MFQNEDNAKTVALLMDQRAHGASNYEPTDEDYLSHNAGLELIRRMRAGGCGPYGGGAITDNITKGLTHR